MNHFVRGTLKTATETHGMLKYLFGEETLSQTAWFAQFTNGRISATDDPHLSCLYHCILRGHSSMYVTILIVTDNKLGVLF
jgi:hypothetical protein